MGPIKSRPTQMKTKKKQVVVRQLPTWFKEYTEGPINVHRCFLPAYCEALWIQLLRFTEKLKTAMVNRPGNAPDAKRPVVLYLGDVLNKMIDFNDESLDSQRPFADEVESVRIRICRMYEATDVGVLVGSPRELKTALLKLYEPEFTAVTSLSPELEVQQVVSNFSSLIGRLVRRRMADRSKDFEELLQASAKQKFLEEQATILQRKSSRVAFGALGDTTHFRKAVFLFSIQLTKIVLEQYQSLKNCACQSMSKELAKSVIPSPSPPPVERPETTFSDLPSKLQRQIFKWLKSSDHETCRFVCSQWRDIVSEMMNFGFWLNDSTKDWISNSKITSMWLAVGDLREPLDIKKMGFAQKALDLVFEVHSDTFVIPTEGNPLTDTPDLIYRGNSSLTVLKSNLLTILENANMAFSVCFLQFALTDLNKVENFSERIENVHLPNLCALTALVTNEDVYALVPLMMKTFSKLKEITLKFHSLRRFPTVYQYETFHDFFVRHSSKLSTVQLVNPPLQPDLPSVLKSGTRRSGPSLGEHLVVGLQALKLKDLKLRMLDFPGDSSRWVLTRIIIEHAKHLESLECAGIDGNLVKRALEASASTLTSFTVVGSFEKWQSDFYCSDVHNCNQLRKLCIREFPKVHELRMLPHMALSTLEIWSKTGLGVADTDIRCIAEKFKLLRNFTVRNRDIPLEATMKAIINSKLVFVCLSKFSEDVSKYLFLMYHGVHITTERVPDADALAAPVPVKPVKAGSRKVPVAPGFEERVIIQFNRTMLKRKTVNDLAHLNMEHIHLQLNLDSSGQPCSATSTSANAKKL